MHILIHTPLALRRTGFDERDVVARVVGAGPRDGELGSAWDGVGSIESRVGAAHHERCASQRQIRPPRQITDLVAARLVRCAHGDWATLAGVDVLLVSLLLGAFFDDRDVVALIVRPGPHDLEGRAGHHLPGDRNACVDPANSDRHFGQREVFGPREVAHFILPRLLGRSQLSAVVGLRVNVGLVGLLLRLRFDDRDEVARVDRAAPRNLDVLAQLHRRGRVHRDLDRGDCQQPGNENLPCLSLHPAQLVSAGGLGRHHLERLSFAQVLIRDVGPARSPFLGDLDIVPLRVRPRPGDVELRPSLHVSGCIQRLCRDRQASKQNERDDAGRSWHISSC